MILSDRRILRVNTEIEQIFGWNRVDLEGQSIRVLYPSSVDYEKTGSRWHRWLESRPRYEDERFMQCRSGEIIWTRARGRTLTPADPFHLMVWTFEHLRDRPPSSAVLTAKEREVARYIVNGHTSKEIAQSLGISPRTVEVHRGAIMKKLGVRNAAELVAGLRELGDFEISVSAYPEKHPESPDEAADIDMLKRKVDNGASRALTQFFFDNDVFERYLERVRAAGISIPIVPGIMPIQNLTQLKRFASMCGATIPAFLDERFAGLDDQPQARAEVAADVAAEQIEDLVRRGVGDFHLYTMNRSALVSATLTRLGLAPAARAAECGTGAAA